MQLFWHGLSCIRIEATHGDQDAILVTDPFDGDETGLRFPRYLKPDILVLSHQDTKRFPKTKDVFETIPFTVADPGEYESHGAFVYALPLKDGDYPYPLFHRFVIEGMNVAFLGGVNRRLTDAEIESLENVDILLIPVGGNGLLGAKDAAEMVRKIEPRIVIPLAFQVEGMKGDASSVEVFLREVGAKTQEKMSKLKIVRKDLPAEDILTVVLEKT
jgi:L-ascorbate metabolism protein UlaG (beta-lactamase superfamily)